MKKTKRLTDTERREKFKQTLILFGMNSPPDDRVTSVSYGNYRVEMIEVKTLVNSQPEFIEMETRELINLYVPQLMKNLFVQGDLIMAGICHEEEVWKIVWSSELYY